MDDAREVARAVLYEGYLLWPYRRSALKNQRRWTLGGVHPEPYSRARGGDDPWWTRTQCLVQAAPGAALEVRVRFLHVVTREVCRRHGDRLEPVPELTVGGERHLASEEASEREVAVAVPALDGVTGTPHREPIDIPAGGHTEWLGSPPAGAVVRGWEALRGHVEVRAEQLEAQLFLVTVAVANTTPYGGGSRTGAVRRAFMSAHTVLHTPHGRFVSLIDPPESLREAAERCRNVGTWPVLAGPEGDRHTVLSAPIILYDHPRVAPESPGDLFDATEIELLLTLNVLSLTEQEQREMRDGDPRAREILDRCTALSPEQLMRLHGTMRGLQPTRSAPAPAAAPQTAPETLA